MKAFVPADAITPANIGLTRQPAQAAPLRITGHGSRAVEHFVGRLLRVQQLHQKQSESRDRIAVRSLQPIELTAIGQPWKRFSQVIRCIAVKRSFARKLHPLSKQGQRDHLTLAELRQRAGFGFLWLIFRLVKIVHHDVQCGYEGIQIDLKLAPFLTNWFDKLTVRSGSLLFNLFLIHTKRLSTPSASKKTTSRAGTFNKSRELFHFLVGDQDLTPPLFLAHLDVEYVCLADGIEGDVHLVSVGK